MGLDTLVGLFAQSPADMATRLETLAGSPLAEVRTTWIRTVIGQAPQRQRER